MAEEKLLGTVRLKYDQLEKDVADINGILAKLGGSTNLDMSKVLESQMKGVADSQKAELQKAINTVTQQASKAGAALTPVKTSIENITKVTQTINQKGIMTQAVQGYDELGNKIREVTREGEKLYDTIETKGSFQEALEEANRLYAEQHDVLQRLYKLRLQQQKTDADSLEAAVLRQQIEVLEEMNDKNKTRISQLDQTAAAQSRVSRLTEEEIKLQQQYAQEVAKLQDIQKKGEQTTKAKQETALIKDAEEALRNLTSTYSKYLKAQRTGNQDGMNDWGKMIASYEEYLGNIDKAAQELGVDETTRRKILEIQEKMRAEQSQFNKDVEAGVNKTQQMGEIMDAIVSKIVNFAATVVIGRVLQDMWRSATSYASEYYDLMNQIRIVSGKTEAEADALGKTYRQMAKDMKVTSQEIASAAVEFWRQGLSESEVEKRLEATIQYAKISDLEFKDAAELMTAATNTYGIAAQRVADVWAVQGDESAAGADEIGQAMQKAAASASEFGLSFEWLGAYIATISEKTREAPEVIGTSLNSLMGRLHSIKQMGYNEEDETKVNDVAKALNAVNIALFDSEGQWRDMNLIFDEIAAKWKDMDDKQRAYISTTLAGTRQQNRFITLMSDMALGLEGGSRAYALYEQAMNSAGVAAQKYAIYQETVQAAQDRLTVSLQELYDALVNGSMMKDFYNAMSGIVDTFTAGTEAMDAWNIKLPLLAAAVASVVAIAVKLKGVVEAIQAQGLLTSLTGQSLGNIGGIALGVTAAVALVTTAVGAIAQMFTTSEERLAQIKDQISQIDEKTALIDEVRQLKEEYDELNGVSNKSNEQMARFSELKKSIPSLLEQITGETVAYENMEQVIENLNAQYAEMVKNKRDLAQSAVEESGKDYKALANNVAYYNNEINRLENDRRQKQSSLKSYQEQQEFWDKTGAVPNTDKEYVNAKQNVADQQNEIGALDTQIEQNVNEFENLKEQMKGVFESTDWESLILGYDEAGREAAEAFKDAFQFDVNPLEKLEDFPAMLDSVAGSEAVKNAKRVYDDALEAWTNGGDESITLNQLQGAYRTYQKAMAEAAGVTQEALDFTGTNVDAFCDRISQLHDVFTNYGIAEDFEQVQDVPLGAGSIQRLENFIDGLLEIPDLREDAVAGLISGYVDNLVQGNEEALAQTEKQLEEMGAHIVETVVTDTELVEAAITQAQEKWKEIVNQRLLESAQEEGFKSYYQVLENALKEGDGGQKAFEEAWASIPESIRDAMMESDETLVEFISQLGELEEGGFLAASAAEYLAKKLAELSDADLQNLKALQEAEGGAMDYGQYQRWQAAKSHQYGAQLTTMEGMQENGNIEGVRAYLNGLRVSSPEIYSDLMDLSDAMKALGTDASLTAAEGLEILAGAMSSASGEAAEGKTAFEQMGEDIARLAGEIDLQEALGAQDEYASGALDYLQEQMSEAIKAGENLEDKLGSVWANLSDAAKSTLVERLGDFTKGMQDAAGSGEDAFAAYMDAVRAAVAQGVFQDLGAQYAQQLEASQAQEELYAGQIAALQRQVSEAGNAKEKVLAYMTEQAVESPVLFEGFVDMYPEVQEQLQGTADQARMQEIVNGMYTQGLETIREQVAEKQQQLVLDARLAKSAEQMYKPALELLREAYQSGGAQGFAQMWEMLPDEQIEGLVSTYGEGQVSALDRITQSGGSAAVALAQIDALLAMQGTDVDMFSMVNASLSSVKTNLDAVQSALAEQSKTGYLTYETYQNLVKANGEYANAIEYTGSALRLNAKEAAQIDQEQMEALKRQTQTSAMEAMRKYAQDKAMLDSEKEQLRAMEERRAAQEEIAQQQEKVSQAQSELDAQQEQVRNFQVMTAEIEGMTSAYYQYLKALDTPNQGAIFDQVPSMVEALKEAVQSGRMFTDDVESAAQFIMGTGIDLSGDPKERKKQLNDIVKAANKYADDYKRIVKDLGSLEGVSVEGVEVSFAEGVTLDSLAEQWGLGPEMVQAMLDTLAEYGYNIPPLKVSVPEIEWTGDLSSAAKGLLDDLMGDAPSMGERGEQITRMQEFQASQGEEYAALMGDIDGIFGKKTSAAQEQWQQDNAAFIDIYAKWQHTWDGLVERYRSGENLGIDEIKEAVEQYNEITQGMEEIGLDGLSAIDTENITSMDDLIRGIAPSEDVDVDEADAVSSEMLTFIEQYKELLSLMSTLNMEDIAKNMPSAGQLSQVVSKALEGADTASGVEQLNQAMSELSGAIESAVTASSEDKEKLDQAAQDMASAVEGFIQAYRSIGGVFEGQDGGAALKEAVASLEGWNPFASFSAGASDAASQVEGISAAVDTVSEKQVGDLGAQQTANDLQKIISKLNEIKDYKIPAKTVQVSVQRTSAVPSNAKGTEDSPGGQSFVAEEGRELIYRKNAGKVELANSMQLTTLEPGDQVIPHAETERILRRRDMTAYDGYAKGTKSNKKLKKELERIEEAQDRLGAEVSYYDAAEQYHSVRNELDSVEYYVGKRLEVNKQEEEQLRGAIDLLLERMEELETKQKKYKEGSKKWNKLQKQIDETGDSLLDYRTQLVQTITEQQELTQEIEQTQQQMREAQIDIRNEIEQAIQDREDLQDRMLQGRISMEELIMQTLEDNLEREKEIAQEAADARVDAIQAEIDKIDELLNARKELSEKEDKQEELAGLEAQLARISADPTRAKERLELEKQIAQLREEIAWDIAEEEAEAQKKALEEQIKNIEDYKDEISGEEDEVDRADLIAQMEEILKGTDEEIIAWLKEHNQDYADSTKAAQTDMVNGWQDTLDDMNGVIRTHWDEVESIIAQGESAIIDFLKANSSQYKEASKLQAEAYVEGWQETQREAGISASTGGQAGSGGEAAPSTPITNLDPHLADLAQIGSFTEVVDGMETIVGKMYGYKYKNKNDKWVEVPKTYDQEEAFENARRAAQDYWNESDFPGSVGKARRKALNAATYSSPGKYLKAYSQGGLVDYTGLAMVHGTPDAPESFLNAQDTVLLSQLRDALRAMPTIAVPLLAGLRGPVDSGAGQTMMQVGDITVNVDRIDDEQDLEVLARRVGEAILNGAQRAAAPAWP